jgi:hypothetical protein
VPCALVANAGNGGGGQARSQGLHVSEQEIGKTRSRSGTGLCAPAFAPRAQCLMRDGCLLLGALRFAATISAATISSIATCSCWTTPHRSRSMIARCDSLDCRFESQLAACWLGRLLTDQCFCSFRTAASSSGPSMARSSCATPPTAYSLSHVGNSAPGNALRLSLLSSRTLAKLARTGNASTASSGCIAGRRTL